VEGRRGADPSMFNCIGTSVLDSVVESKKGLYGRKSLKRKSLRIISDVPLREVLRGAKSGGGRMKGKASRRKKRGKKNRFRRGGSKCNKGEVSNRPKIRKKKN